MPRKAASVERGSHDFSPSRAENAILDAQVGSSVGEQVEEQVVVDDDRHGTDRLLVGEVWIVCDDLGQCPVEIAAVPPLAKDCLDLRGQ